MNSLGKELNCLRRLAVPPPQAHIMAHQKHAKLTRPNPGTFSGMEWAILGISSDRIKELAVAWIQALSGPYRLAFVDADFKRLDETFRLKGFQHRAFFRNVDAVLADGNHFPAQRQIVVIDANNSLEQQLPQLTQVDLMLLEEGQNEIPGYLKEQVAGRKVSIFSLNDQDRITQWLATQLQAAIPPIKGLVLAGGRSTRMKQDKGLLKYHGKNQREHAYELLESLLGRGQVHLSCRQDQVAGMADHLQALPDTFLGLGPFGGILSALREDPNAAWLVIACDLPLLTENSLRHLLEARNPSVLATAFQSPIDELPEPLIALWEPRAYATLLEFLAMGQASPRQVLLHSKIELIQATQAIELTNVNLPEEFQTVKATLNQPT
ncbi:MAG: NTP transferase domain-containing protein [Bacteroidota bacterium]